MVALNEVPVQTEHTIEIKKIISGGIGLGHLDDGMVIMAPFVLPGETVKLSETKRFSGYIQAKTLQIERPSRKRLPPFCSQFGTCGGCALQHTPYPNQLAIKKEILVETLSRGHVLPEEDIPLPVPSPKAEGYRHKIRLHIGKNGRIGFHRMQSHELVQIEHCPLAAPALNEALRRLLQSDLLHELARFCTQMELICSPADNAVVATLHLLASKQPPQTLLDEIRKRIKLRNIALKFNRKTSFFPEPILLQQPFSVGSHEYTLKWDSRCFFQVNPEQNQQLVELVCTRAGNVTGRKILDLFCGMGNFSIPLGLAGAEVTGIELNKHSIRATRRNAQDAGIHADRFIAGDVSRHLQRLRKKESRFDLILLDPPRQGLGRAIQLLLRLEADKILYISCDPATLTRDLQPLIREDYSLKSVTPVDMFPQTHHIECLAVLEKN